MSGHAQLTYRDLDKAFAFHRGSHDEDGVVTAVDHPEFYCVTKTNGVHRSALPPMIDRGATSYLDAEDAIIARIDGDVENEDEIEADGCDDLFRMDEDDEADQEYEEAWRDMIAQAAPASPEAAPVSATVVARTVEVRTARMATSSPATRNLAIKKVLSAADDELAPVAISSRRAALVTHGENTDDDAKVRKVHSWKDASAAPTQFLRHVRRPNERPIKRAAGS